VNAEIVLVGGGVMGAAIARVAAERLDPIGQPLVLLERGAELASGSSGRSGAILRQHYADPQLGRMARDSLREYADFENRTGRAIGFRRTGALTLAGPRAPQWVERVRRNVEMLQSIGVDTRLVEAAEIRDLVPGIEVDAETVGAWEPGAGFVDAHRTVEELAALARMHGAITRMGVEVQDVVVRDGRVAGVETSEGTIEARAVVVVAGPWSARLLARAGVELPLRTVRPEQYFIATPERDVAAPAPRAGDEAPEVEEPNERIEREALARREREPLSLHPIVIDLEGGYYTRCEPVQWRTRIGRIDYGEDRVLSDPDELVEEVEGDGPRWAREAIVARLPAYRDRDDDGAQAAWYALSPDAQALIGPVPGVEGLWVATGFSGHGFKLAPSVATGVTQMLFDEPVTAFDPDFFAPARFAGRAPDWTGAFGL